MKTPTIVRRNLIVPNLPPMIWNCRWSSRCSLQPTVLLHTRLPTSERLARARELSVALPPGRLLAQDIDASKRQGRP